MAKGTPMPAGTTVVALLLPLSGPSAAIGGALFNAAQLALFEVGDESVTLVPIDSKGTAEGATLAAQAALAQHAEMVIGPLLASETAAAAAVLRPAHIPVLALTTKRSLAGGGIYVLGLQPGRQALRVIAFAHEQNIGRLAVLAPSNDIGRTVAEDAANGAADQGVTVTALEYYGPADLDFAPAINRLLAHRHGDDPGFDAILIPDEGMRLRRVVSALTLAGIDQSKVKLLGTMLWDEVRGEPSMAGAWYTVPPAASFAAFEKRYVNVFGARPPRLASLAYDATALAAVLGRNKAHDFSTAALTDSQGFAGADGLFRLRPDGTADRSYAIMEIEAGAPSKELVPAPTKFESAD